jgi:hypothetical protein
MIEVGITIPLEALNINGSFAFASGNTKNFGARPWAKAAAG